MNQEACLETRFLPQALSAHHHGHARHREATSCHGTRDASNHATRSGASFEAAAQKGTSPALRPGEYSPDYCESPTASDRSSCELMDIKDDRGDFPDRTTKEESPRTSVAADHIGRLSLESERELEQPRNHSTLSASRVTSNRAVDLRLQFREGRPPPRFADGARPYERKVCPDDHKNLPQGRNCHHSTSSGEAVGRRMIDAKRAVRPFVQSHDRPKRDDSGYISATSRRNTARYHDEVIAEREHAAHETVPECGHECLSQSRKGVIQLTANGQHSEMILQPDSSPISQDQLAAEVKGIYAGLVMVEAKCINIDHMQASNPTSELVAEQWSALIALHRTLLYEHHDFLMATQHPSATPALRGLAVKYSMPARMWKHGIHAFLEVLRQRRPHSQDYMLAFIYLAYQMMALLFETVPSFTDTWIECLGDLARYRMAIEEDREQHSIWGSVAARWYTMASDRHPAIGRLYHHLGILERPSLRKMCLYAKSLTCVISFPNAKDSLMTLCNPIIQDEHTVQSSCQSAEARIVTLHALLCSRSAQKSIDAVYANSLLLLSQQPVKLHDFGAYLAITNVSQLLELGAPTNHLLQQYQTAINQTIHETRPSAPSGIPALSARTAPAPVSGTKSLPPASAVHFWSDCFNTVLQSYDWNTTFDNALSFLHVMLACLHSFHSLRTRLNSGRLHHTSALPVDLGRLHWQALATFLNLLLEKHPVHPRILECARQGIFPAPECKEDAHPLSEDYLIRGLIWTRFYFSPGWFDRQCEDDGRAIETDRMQDARAERVLWLGLYLALHSGDLQFDIGTRQFSAYVMTPAMAKAAAAGEAHEVEAADRYTEQISETPTPGSRSSLASSSSTESEDGFAIVKAPKRRDTRSSSLGNSARKAKAPRTKKQRHDLDGFKVANENGIVCPR